MLRTPLVKTFFVGCASLILLQGCLSGNYQVSHAELVRLAQRPPAVRGEHVRVLQQTAYGADDVGWGDVDEDASSPPQTTGSINVTTSQGGGDHDGGAGRFGQGGPGPSGSGSGFGSGPGSGHSGAAHGGLVHSGAGRVGSTSGSAPSGGGSWGGGGGGGGEEAIVMAIVAVVIANGIGVALAIVEGRRFDGWARVQPEQRLLLVTSSGSQWLPLSALTEHDAAIAERAVIVDEEANVQRLDRAPLDRKGFSYEFELGSARLNTAAGTRDFGFASRTGIGYFPTQTLGLLFASQVAFGDADETRKGGAIFNGRIGAELEFLPVRAWRVHAGLYTELGGALALQDLPDRTHSWSGLYAATGFLAQIDWTTRLAVNLRCGIAALPAHPASAFTQRNYVPELTLGIAVY